MDDGRAAALGMSRVLLGSRDDTADAVQDGMLAAWRGLPALREPETFPAWFRKLVIRPSMRRVRSRRPVVELDLEIAAPAALSATKDRPGMCSWIRPYGRASLQHFAAVVRPSSDASRRRQRETRSQRSTGMSRGWGSWSSSTRRRTPTARRCGLGRAADSGSKNPPSSFVSSRARRLLWWARLLRRGRQTWPKTVRRALSPT